MMHNHTRVKTRKSLLSRLLTSAKEIQASASWRGKKQPGGGYVSTVPDLGEWYGTTRQTCGQWPFGRNSVAPNYGAKLGVHFFSRQPIGFDPLTWHEKRFIFNPSVFLLANPSTGKSSALRKMMIGCIASGTNVIVAGDRKNEHTNLVRLMGGQVISLGPGRGKINVLDPGGVLDAVDRINTECEDKNLAREITAALLGDMHSRRLSMVIGLIGIFRQNRVSGHETAIIDSVLRWMHRNEDGVPIIDDILRVLRDAPDDVRRIANDWGDMGEYRRIVRPLENDLVGLTSSGGLGEMFNGQTTEEVKRDRSVAFDIHSIDENERETLSAAYIATWSASFGMINVAHALTDAGLEDGRRYFVVMDEVWQPLAASPGMVDRLNGITRLNREKGVATAYASHTMADLEAIADEADRNKARGIIARCGAVMLGGLSREELEERVSRVTKLKEREIELLVSWNTPPSLVDAGEDMPGRGKFLIKVGEAPGLPIDVIFTGLEKQLGVHDTDKRMRATKVKNGADQ